MSDAMNTNQQINESHSKKGGLDIFFFWFSTFITAGLYPFYFSLINKFGINNSFLVILFACIFFLITALVGVIGFLTGKYTIQASANLFNINTTKLIGSLNSISLIGWQSILVYTFYQMLRSAYFPDNKLYNFLILIFSFFSVSIVPIFGGKVIYDLKKYFSAFFIISSIFVLYSNKMVFSNSIFMQYDDSSFTLIPLKLFFYYVYFSAIISAISYSTISSDYSIFINRSVNKFFVIFCILIGSIIGFCTNFLVASILFDSGQMFVSGTNLVLDQEKMPILIQLMCFLSIISTNMPNGYSASLNLGFVSLNNRVKVNLFILTSTFVIIFLLSYSEIGLISYIYDLLNYISFFIFPWVGVLLAYSLFLIFTHRKIVISEFPYFVKMIISYIFICSLFISFLLNIITTYVGIIQFSFSFLLTILTLFYWYRKQGFVNLA